MKLPPSPQLNFLKGPHGDGRGQAALALCRVDPWAFLGDLWNERKHSPSFSLLEDDTSPTKPPWIFLGKKMSRPPALSCQKNGFVLLSLQPSTPPNKNVIWWKASPEIAANFYLFKLKQTSRRIAVFFVKNYPGGTKHKNHPPVDEVMESRRGGWGIPAGNLVVWGRMGFFGGRDVVCNLLGSEIRAELIKLRLVFEIPLFTIGFSSISSQVQLALGFLKHQLSHFMGVVWVMRKMTSVIRLMTPKGPQNTGFFSVFPLWFDQLFHV